MIKKTTTTKKKTTLSNLSNENSQRKTRAIQALRSNNRPKKYKKGDSPSENRGKLLKEWRDSWFS